MTLPLTMTTRLCAVQHQTSVPLAEDQVVLDLQDGIYYTLNHVARVIWQQLQSPTTIGEIVDVLTQSFEGDRATMETAVFSFVEQLMQYNLIEILPN